MMSRLILAVVWLSVSSLGLIACDDKPTAPTDSADEPIVTPQTVTYAGVITAGGTASRSFTAQLAGTATATLSGIAPATLLVVGLGIPRPDGAGCLLARSTTATDGVEARVVANVDPGTFCVQVLAPTPGPDGVSFTVTLEHP
jgi:hypothetical protein